MPARTAGVRVEPMTGAHAAAVLAIYQAGIDEGNATFETRAPGWPAFTAARLPGHRFVATVAGQIVGWVAASAVSGRCVYAGVVEHSVYVRQAYAAANGYVPLPSQVQQLARAMLQQITGPTGTPLAG